ncbi:MAG: phage portal protein [Verrucomicrobiae bacterium]|nr:phage portal protein [Verrucomicrobiae bacterium]
MVSDQVNCETLRLARDVFGVGLALQRFQSKFFKHGVRAGGILEIPEGMTPDAAKSLQAYFKKHHTGEDNWFSVAVLRDGAKFHSNTMSPEDGQMVESDEQSARQAARVFNCPPSRLGISDSVSYNSKSESNREFYEGCLLPWCTELTSESGIKLLSEDEQDSEEYYFEHNTAAFLRMNPLESAQVYAIGIRNRYLLRNEVRGFMNMNPVEGGDEFDEFPTAGGVSGQKGDSDGGADKTPKDDPESPEGEEDTKKRAALVRIVYRATDHAREKSHRSRAFVEWIDGNMRRHRERPEIDERASRFLDEFVAEMRAILNEVSERDLPSAVDQACHRFEEELCDAQRD